MPIKMILIVVFACVIGCGGAVTNDNSTIKLYLTSSDYNMVPIQPGNYSLINFDKNTRFIVHGYNENSTLEMFTTLTQQILIKGGYDIIAVDWSQLAAGPNYLAAAANTKLVGNFLGNYIIGLNQVLSKISIVGFSLGAHIAGFAGKLIKSVLQQQIHSITGLDPAGPFFGFVIDTLEKNRLAPNDAAMVVVLHTNKGVYGTKFDIGQVNFNANGGYNQPGCLILNTTSGLTLQRPELCSHELAVDYYAEAINSNKFVATSKYDPANTLIFGSDFPDGTTGVYNFKTNREPPYAQG